MLAIKIDISIHFWDAKLKPVQYFKSYFCVCHNIFKTFRTSVLCCVFRRVVGLYTEILGGFNISLFFSINNLSDSSGSTLIKVYYYWLLTKNKIGSMYTHTWLYWVIVLNCNSPNLNRFYCFPSRLISMDI